MSVVLLVATAWAAVLAQTPAANATISGHVADAITGRPIAGVLIQIRHQPRRDVFVYGQHRPPRRSAVTDATGVFTLEAVESGEYIVNASKGGYLQGAYGSKRPYGALGRVKVQDGARVDDVVIQLWPEASIEGRVTDERGRPVIGATVSVIADEADVYAASPFGSATTDDRGIYRIPRLLPGQYAVAVTSDLDSRAIDRSTVPRSKSSGSRTGEPFLLDPDGRNILFVRGPMPAASLNGRPNLYVTSFFGGQTLAQARRLRLKAGETRSRIDVTFRSRPAVRVAGTIVGPTGALPGIAVELRPEGQPNELLLQYMYAVAAPNGAFSFVLAPPGRYVLTARKHLPTPTPVRLDDAGIAVTGYDDVMMSDEEDYSLEMPLTIADTDITDLSLVIRPGVGVSGRVVDEDGHPVDMKEGRTLLFAALDGNRYGSDSRGAQVAADGTFSFKARPGRYIIVGPTHLSKLWLKTASLNGQDITDGPFAVGTDPVQGLTVVLTSKATNIQGSVVDSAGRQTPECIVVVFPGDRSRWDALKSSDRAHRLECADGTFKATGLLPADYFVAAVDDSLMNGWPSRATLDRLTRIATRVRLDAGQPVQLKLTVQDRDR